MIYLNRYENNFLVTGHIILTLFFIQFTTIISFSIQRYYSSILFRTNASSIFYIFNLLISLIKYKRHTLCGKVVHSINFDHNLKNKRMKDMFSPKNNNKKNENREGKTSLITYRPIFL